MLRDLLFAAVLPLVFGWRYTRCPAECSCTLAPAPELDEASHLRTVDCTARGLRAFPAPEHLPSDAQVLRLTDNRIRRLRPGLRLWLPELLLLDLSGNRLLGLPAASAVNLGSFEGLSALRCLSLARNNIRRLGSDAFTGLVALRELDLSGNHIDGIMDDAFEGLSKLETLKLSGNRLSYIQRTWWESTPGLLSLDLSSNSIGLLQDDAFRGLPQLTYLQLSENKLFRISDHAFFGLRRLGTLSLAANSLTSLPQTALIQLRKSLRFLDASRNPVFRIAMEDLANFDQLKELKLATMTRLRLVERGAFKNLPNLIKLELHDSPFFAYLDPVAFVNMPSLSHLYLHNNNLSVLESPTLQSLPALVELSFYGNPLACDCNSRWLRQQLTSGKVRFSEADRLICASPEHQRFKRFTMLNEEDLPQECAPRLIHLFDADLERKLGEDSILDCRAVGVPSPSISWIAPDGSVIDAAQYHPRRLLSNGNTLILRHLQFQDAGRYSCIAISERGEDINQARLNVSAIQVEIVPLATTESTATVTWRGLDRSGNVFQVMYRDSAEDSRHRYGGSVSPSMRSFTLQSLDADREYEICLAFEDGQGILTHISCAFMRTAPLRGFQLFSERLRSGPTAAILAGVGVAVLALLLCATMLVAARRGRARPFAYDNLANAELGSPDLRGFRKPAYPRLETNVSLRSSVDNDYSPLVPGHVV